MFGRRNQQNEVTDKVFEAFSKKVGVASIREYEETRLQQQMQAAEKRAQYKTQVRHPSRRQRRERARHGVYPVSYVITWTCCVALRRRHQLPPGAMCPPCLLCLLPSGMLLRPTQLGHRCCRCPN